MGKDIGNSYPCNIENALKEIRGALDSLKSKGLVESYEIITGNGETVLVTVRVVWSNATPGTVTL